MGKLKRLLSVIVMAVVAVSCFTAYGIINAKADTSEPSAQDSLVYQLDFADSANRMDNVSGSSVADATLVTDGTNATFTDNAINGKTALNLTKAGSQKNYVTIPGEVINHDSVTITAWVKQSKDIAQWTRPFSVYTENSNRMEIMPNAQQGLLNVSLVQGGSAIQYKGEGSITWSSTRMADDTNHYSTKGNLTSVYGAWAHYAYEFTPDAFNYYVNGELYFTVKSSELREGHTGRSLSLKQIYDATKNTRLVIGATLCDTTVDYTGSFADVRVYSKALSSAELKEIIGYKDYKDYLLASYDFEDSSNYGKDSVGGWDGTLVNTATVVDGKLVLDGNGVGVAASQFTIPATVVETHPKLTISLDMLVESNVNPYSRVFEITPSWKEQLLLALNWNHGGATYVGKMVAKHSLINNADITYTPVNFTSYDKWVNLVFTTDGETFSVYADGVILTTGAMDYHGDIFNYKGAHATVVSFGGSPKSTSDKGTVCSMDNIKIYNTSLTASEVLAEYETAHPKAEELWLDAILSDVSLENGSYLDQLSEKNIEYMMKLDEERLLFNHRKVAGLDTKGATSYDGWESQARGLSGQMASNYLAALARASASMPNYSYNGSKTVAQRLDYMVKEFKKCQDAYAVYDPANAGYWGGLHMNQYECLVGESSQYPNQYKGYGAYLDTYYPDGEYQNVFVWVPWRVAHDNIKSLYDVAIYANTAELRQIGEDMMYAYADWMYNLLQRYTPDQRARVVKLEYGGMGEALWNITYYAQKQGLDEKAGHYAFCANIFQQSELLNAWRTNTDILSNGHEGQTDGMHANTAIPKIFACVAAYEATGDETYLTAAKNAWNMIVGTSDIIGLNNDPETAGRLYAFGGQGLLENWVHTRGNIVTRYDTAETCCTLNMLKLADYLFRWTGDVKYADFYELAFTNHTLTSMDPETAGKTYFVSTEFGGHKIYHAETGHFWCCTSTGFESFTKLNYGIYYVNKAGDVTVNTFYGSTYKVNDNVTLIQTGDFYSSQSTKITIQGSGNFAIRLRVPDWAQSGFTVKVNGVEQSVTEYKGYITLDRNWADGDYIDYTVPFDVWFKNLNLTSGYKAMMYGPLTMVAKLDPVAKETYIKDYSKGTTAYTGSVKDQIQHMGNIANSLNIATDAGYPIITLTTENQGVLSFEPFNRVFHNRYGMYFKYTETPEVSGNEVEYDFTSPADAGANSGYEVVDGKLVNNKDGALLTLIENNPNAYSLTYVLTVGLDAVNAGAIVMGNLSSNVNGYYVGISKSGNTLASLVGIYKVTNGVMGEALATKSITSNQKKDVEIKILISGTNVMVIVTADAQSSFSILADSAVANASVALYTVSGNASFKSAKVVSEIASTKALLQNAIAYAESYDSTLYTSASVKAVADALVVAQGVYANGSAEEQDYKDANVALRTAIKGLAVLADASTLDAKLAEIALLDPNGYTVATWNALQSQVDYIKALDTSDMSQADFDAQLAELDRLVKALVVKGDRTALDAKIAEAEALNESDYTETSWKNLQNKLKLAKGLKEDANQTQIDYQLDQLTKAINQLAEKIPSNPSNPDDGGNSGSTPETPDDDGATDEGSGSMLGGCSMGIGSEVYFVFAMALALAVVLLVKKIKRHNA